MAEFDIRSLVACKGITLFGQLAVSETFGG